MREPRLRSTRAPPTGRRSRALEDRQQPSHALGSTNEGTRTHRPFQRRIASWTSGGRLPRRLGINVWVHLHQYECRSAVSGRYRSTLLFLQTSRSILQRCRPSRCAISFLGSPVSIKPRRWQRCLSESRFIGVLWRSRTSRAVVFERKSRTTWGEEPLLI